MIDFESDIPETPLGPAVILGPAVNCLHCGLPIPPSLHGHSEFCCAGCKNVYLFIGSAGLDEFYELRDRTNSGPFGPGSFQRPPEESSVSAHLDDPEFARRYQQPQPNGLQRITFFLEGIHCAACVWLLERLPELCPGVIVATVNLPQSRMVLEFNPNQIRLSEVAQVISSLGYSAHPLRQDTESLLRTRAERMALIRLGVAAVSAMNTMLLAVSIYQGWFTGMDANVLRYFTRMSLLLSLPAVLFSALPFYRTALAGLRQRVMHIDLPLSVAIVLGFLLSAWNTFQGNAQVYFDTVTALIFLLLSARYLQQRGLNASSARMSIFSALSPLWARRFQNGVTEDVYIESVSIGDVLEVRAGERFPVDGSLVSGSTEIDESVLTGESAWISAAPGHAVWGGTLNCQNTVVMEAKRSHAESRIGQLIHQLENAPRRGGALVHLTDRLSGYFVAAILFLAVGGGCYWGAIEGSGSALSVVLALLVVSCPCALGLAAPLAYSSALRGLAENGVFVRDAELLELLQRSKTFVFDKTGVLTETEFSVSEIWLHKSQESTSITKERLFFELPAELLSALFSLESQSSHLLARGLTRFLRDGEVSGVEAERLTENFRESTGVGAVFDGKPLLVGSAEFLKSKGVSLPDLGTLQGFTSQSLVYFACERQVLCIFGLQAKIRNGSLELIRDLQRSGRSVFVLSGDHDAAVQAVASQLEISPSRVFSECGPEQKLQVIRELESRGPVVMIGDGANDTSALQAAAVGVAASGAADAAVEVAGISISPFRPEKISFLLSSIERMNRLIRWNFIFSIFYNSIAATAALIGRVNPLVAAVIMPLSSFTVLLSTLAFPVVAFPVVGFPVVSGATQRKRAKWK